jgi:hypothetical protein
MLTPTSGGGGAPTTSNYFLKTSDGSLSNATVNLSLNNYDVIPTSPHADDDEFDAGSLAGAWTQTTSGTITNVFEKSRLIFIPSTTGAGTNITKARTAGNHTWTAKFHLMFGAENDTTIGNYQSMNLGLKDSVGNKTILYVWGFSHPFYSASNIPYMAVEYYNAGVYSSTPASATWPLVPVGVCYLQMQDDGSNFKFRYSYDGMRYRLFCSVSNSAWLANPADQIQIGFYGSDSSKAIGAVDWFRVGNSY